MIDVFLRINNPFPPKNPDMKQRDFVVWEPRITWTKNKAFCFQFSQSPPYQLFEFSLGTNWRGSDHAGPHLDLTLFGFFLHMNLYDIRHWDYENDCWEEEAKA